MGYNLYIIFYLFEAERHSFKSIKGYNFHYVRRHNK